MKTIGLTENMAQKRTSWTSKSKVDDFM